MLIIYSINAFQIRFDIISNVKGNKGDCIMKSFFILLKYINKK